MKKKRERKTVSRWVIEKETTTHHVAAAAAAVTPIRHQTVKSRLQITSRSSKYETHFFFFSSYSYSYSSFSCCCRRCCKTRNPGAELVRFLEFQTPSSTPRRDPSQDIPDLNSRVVLFPSGLRTSTSKSRPKKIFAGRAAATPPPYSQDVLINHIY